MSTSRWHVTGVDPQRDEAVDLWIADGVFVDGPVTDAVQVSGFVTSGLVDAHCHIGYSASGAVDLVTAHRQARVNRAAGVTAIRDCGSPIDTRPLVGLAELPVLIRAGRHLARPKRYIRDLGIDVAVPQDLPAEVARQLDTGAVWIKLVGDWIDRDLGDLAPLWPDDVLARAVAIAHEAGARVTAHVFGEDALPGLLAAGIDCLEHGTGLTAETIATMVAGDVHLVPTLINIENFPGFADAATRFPVYAAHIRELHRRGDATVAAAIEAGVAVHAGTDAGGYIEHGRIVDEVASLVRIGMTPAEALRAAGDDARTWLGLPGREPGERADLVVHPTDPRRGVDALRRPALVLTAGSDA